jgi:SAM-dependent methyltransferase
MSAWVLVILVFVGLLSAVKLCYVFATGWHIRVTEGALFVPTAPVRISSSLDAVPMGPRELFVDLGCGDGRVLKAARKRFGVRALGFEVNPLIYLLAKARTLWDGGIRIRRRNFWRGNLAEADVVFCYLFPDLMERLGRKLEGELKRGARVISCNFPIPGWNPSNVLRPASDRHGDPIYIYLYPDACGKSGPGF